MYNIVVEVIERRVERIGCVWKFGLKGALVDQVAIFVASRCAECFSCLNQL